jgi:nicotinamide riboside kinase
VRVAFSGAHRTGKTTLVAALADHLPAYTVVDEPYRVLEEAGHEFSDPPSVEDYEQQLRTSLELVSAAPADALLDRCPLDLIAYLQVIADDFEIDDWLDDVRDAIARIDLIVVVPIETPDRIAVADHEDRRLRRRVNERLQRLVMDDPFGIEAQTLEVSGSLDERIRQVIRAMQP